MNQPAQGCPDLGRWRAWLDGIPDGEAAALNEHLAACARCPDLVRDLRENAALAAALIRPLRPEGRPSAAAIELARARIAAARAGEHREERRRMTQAIPLQRFGRWRAAIGGMAAALVLLAVFGTPQGRGATAQFLAQFRGERFVPLPLSTAQLQNLERTFTELQQVGTVTGLEDVDDSLRQVDTIAEAERIAGFPVKTPDPATLPAGAGATPSRIMVMPAGTVRFTFDQAKARAHYQATGRPGVELPDRYDGVSVVVRRPAAVVLQYGGSGEAAALPGGAGVLIGQAEPLTLTVDGDVSLEGLREFLLGLPGLSRETVRLLQAIDDWRATMPIPIPVDEVNWRRTTVAGAEGLLLSDPNGLGSIVIWQGDDRIYGVGGAAPAREVQRIADGLR